MSVDVSEQVTVAATPDEVYRAVADPRRMTRWSPECFAVWVRPQKTGQPVRFVGFNRRGFYVWFTSCTITLARPGEEFGFAVAAFGQPVAFWGYKFAAVPAGTKVTEYFEDRRRGAGMVLGRIFTGKVAKDRPAANRENIRTTLDALKRELDPAA
jgi:uncharacterized protein YndB with AHSA1/START domain